MKTAAVLIILFFQSLIVQSQDKPADSVYTLSPSQLIEIVKKFHPVAKQASIMVDKAKASVTIAKGYFDPLLQSDFSRKTFDGTNYYDYSRPSLNIPTWFGIDVSAGMENLSGTRTDPTETRGETSYLGISVPVAKNLLMDKRRAALLSARVYAKSSEKEKQSILNSLLKNSLHAYWNWVMQYQLLTVINKNVEVAAKRVNYVKTAVNIGERPAIDTTEAITQLQYFELLQSETLLAYQNAMLDLSLYLWLDGDRPYDLPSYVRPQQDLESINFNELVTPDLAGFIENSLRNHPDLEVYRYKLEALTIDKKLKWQELLPELNVSYQQLSKGYNFLKLNDGLLLNNNYQYGINFKLPLRLSAGRGEYRKAKLSLEQTQWEQIQKRATIENNIRSYYNEWVAVKKQLIIQERATRNYQQLFRGEETRFNSGESSLFLVNARENKQIEAIQKLQELKAKLLKLSVTIQWAAGLL